MNNIIKTFSFALLLGISTATLALSVSPLVKVYSPGTRAGTLTVYNTSKEKQNYQIFVYTWKLKDGKQVKTKSQALRFVPSIISVDGGKSKTVRFIKQAPVDMKHEQAYRVAVKQLPKPEWKQDTEKGLSLHKVITMTFPWFWRPQGFKPSLKAHYANGNLEITNTGNATARLSQMVAGTLHEKGLVGYALPGETLTFKVKDKPDTVSINSNLKTKTLQVR